MGRVQELDDITRVPQRFSDRCHHSLKYTHHLERTPNPTSSDTVPTPEGFEKVNKKGTLRFGDTRGSVRTGSTVEVRRRHEVHKGHSKGNLRSQTG